MDTTPPIHLLASFHELLPDTDPEWMLSAPGFETWIAASGDVPDRYTLTLVETGARVQFSYQSAKRKQTLLRRPLPHWARYAAGLIVLYSDAFDFGGFRGVLLNAERSGPRADYGFGMAIATLIHTMAGRTIDDATLREWVDRVQREYLG